MVVLQIARLEVKVRTKKAILPNPGEDYLQERSHLAKPREDNPSSAAAEEEEDGPWTRDMLVELADIQMQGLTEDNPEQDQSNQAGQGIQVQGEEEEHCRQRQEDNFAYLMN